jgi:multidrug efflux pump subunit AcrB
VRGTRDAVLIGIVLAGLVLWAFLRKLRLTLIAGLTIPVTVAIVALALGATGQTINLMTLAGLAAAIGLVADDAIVVIENIDRIHAEGRSADPAGDGLRQMLPALVGSSLSTTVILLPFALLAGVVGAFFKPLALTMALALVISFLVAATAVFVSASRFGFRRRPSPEEPRRPRAGWLRNPAGRLAGAWSAVARPAGQAYDRIAGFAIAHGAVAVLVAGGLVAGTLLLYRRIGTDFLPRMDEGSIILDYWTPPGTSLTDTDGMLRQVERIIQATPDVAGYSRRTGTQLGFFITEPNRGDYVINLKPRGTRRPVQTVMDDLRARIQAVEPAVHTDFGQLLEDNIGDLTGGAPQPIDIKLFGDDPAVLQDKARHAARIISGVRGVEDVFDGIVIAGPALDIRVDSRAAARYGLSTEDVHAAVEPAVTGTVVDQVRVNDRMYDLRVFARHDGPLGDLRIRAPAPSAALLPLSTVATIETGAPEAEIDRENLKTFVGVTARLSGRDLGGAIAEIRARLSRELPLPSDMSIRYGGLYQQQQQSFRGLFLVLLAGLGLVSVVVLLEFGDWRAPIVTSLCALASLAGVLVALVLTGMTLNISSYVGAIMMVGIVGENAIFVIHEARNELALGLAPPEAWLRASRRRLRPVAMTVLATAFALAPLALALGEGSQLMQPLAVAVIGGFAVSGPIVLLVLPGLYHLLDPRGRLAAERSAPVR